MPMKDTTLRRNTLLTKVEYMLAFTLVAQHDPKFAPDEDWFEVEKTGLQTALCDMYLVLRSKESNHNRVDDMYAQMKQIEIIYESVLKLYQEWQDSRGFREILLPSD